MVSIPYSSGEKVTERQNEEVVGNALKTTAMRIRGATTELADAGEEIDKYCESTATMRKEIKALSGVDILEADGETFRSTYDIMVDIAKVWGNLTDTNQASLLEALAGKRNASVVKSIITNIDDLTGSYETAQNAIGAVDKANSTYLDSIEGRMAQFTAQFQEFSNEIVDADWFKDLISGATTLLSILQGILTFGDGLIVEIIGLISVCELLQALKIGKIMPAIPEYKNNGRVRKLVNSWEVHTEYYNYKVA